jgi:hypothetical protein
MGWGTFQQFIGELVGNLGMFFQESFRFAVFRRGFSLRSLDEGVDSVSSNFRLLSFDCLLPSAFFFSSK